MFDDGGDAEMLCDTIFQHRFLIDPKTTQTFVALSVEDGPHDVQSLSSMQADYQLSEVQLEVGATRASITFYVARFVRMRGGSQLFWSLPSLHKGMKLSGASSTWIYKSIATWDKRALFLGAPPLLQRSRKWESSAPFDPLRTLDWPSFGTRLLIHSLMVWSFKTRALGGFAEPGDQQASEELLSSFCAAIAPTSWTISLYLGGVSL